MTIFILLCAALIYTTHLDLQSTFHALATNPNAREANPLLRWVVKLGKVPTYALRMAVNALVIWLCWKMRQPGSLQTTIWWLPLAATSAIYLYIAIRNRRFYGRN